MEPIGKSTLRERLGLRWRLWRTRSPKTRAKILAEEICAPFRDDKYERIIRWNIAKLYVRKYGVEDPVQLAMSIRSIIEEVRAEALEKERARFSTPDAE